LLRADDVGLRTTFFDNVNDDGAQRFTYEVRAISNIRPLKVARSNIIAVDLQADVIVPDAFTPNRDGINEELELFPRFATEYTMTIYNRWGELVYSHNQNQRAWNGRYQNTQRSVPTGTYIYNLVFIDSENRTFSKNGSVMVFSE